MSGNPNPPPAPRPRGGGSDPGNDCGSLRFRTQLASPVAAIVAGLTVDEVLSVELRDRAGTRVVAAVTATDDVAGSIIDNIQRLLACIQAGHAYQAIVHAVSGGAVTLDVEPAS